MKKGVKHSKILHKAQALIMPFLQYPTAREKFFREHPQAKIIEEIKTMNMIGIDVPDPQRIGSTKQEQTIGICWGILFTEPENEKDLQNASQLSIQE